jgi:peptide/nickel transport system substrate-binding protein
MLVLKTKGNKKMKKYKFPRGKIFVSLAIILSGLSGVMALGSASASSNAILTVCNGTGGPYSTNFNPLSAGSPTLTGLGGQDSLVYESLLQFNYANSSEVIPWLATSYAWSNGGKTLTFDIRKNVHWSDGKLFTANDVVYTFNLVKKDAALNLGGLNFTSITAPTKWSVVIQLPVASYSSLYYLASQLIVPQHVWSKIKNPANDLNLTPVGTGPYLLKSFTSQNITLVVNPHYWGKEPKVTTLEYPTYYTNGAAEAALDTNNCQWGAPFLASPSKFKSSGNGSHVLWFPPLSSVMLIPNMTVYPLNILAFRQAVNEVINRSAFAHNADLGEETTITNATALVLPRDKSVLDPTYANDNLVLNVKAAKKKLVAAGFTYKGSDLYAPNGKRVTLSVSVDAGFSDWLAGMPTIVQNLISLGVDAKLLAPSNTVYLSDLADGTFDFAIWTQFSSGPGPYYQFDEMLNSQFSAPIGKAAVSNYGRWNDPATNTALNEYAATNNAATQTKAMYAIEGIMVNKVPLFPLEYQVAFGEANTKLFTGWPTPSNPYATLSPYVGNSNELVMLHIKPGS